MTLSEASAETVAVDFAVVPTLNGTLLFVFIVLSLARRRVLHVNVTARPMAHWAAQQIVEAFPWSSAARFLVRDRDGPTAWHSRNASKDSVS
jgi:putative transposase